MLRRSSWLALVLILILPGCTAPAAIDAAEAENEMDIPERLNLIADTANREIDRVETMDVLLDANGKNTMILWVSTGCSGCHDWTEMIADGMRDGNISNDTRIITVQSPQAISAGWGGPGRVEKAPQCVPRVPWVSGLLGSLWLRNS